jgi:DNA gyrase subunit B
MQTTLYEDPNIVTLSLREAVRMRPGMYLGSTGFMGKSNLIKALIDEYLDTNKGYSTAFEIVFKQDNFIEMSFQTTAPDKDFEASFNESTLAGNTLYIVNFVSKYFEIKTAKVHQFFEQGLFVSEKKVQDFTKNVLTFQLDATIFDDNSFYYDGLLPLLKECAVVNKNVDIIAKDVRKKRESSHFFHYTEGVKEFLQELKSGEEHFLNPPIFYFQEQMEDIHYEFGFYCGIGCQAKSTFFLNNHKLSKRGSVADGIIDGIVEVAQKLSDNKLFHNRDRYGGGLDFSFTAEKILPSVCLVCLVKMENIPLPFYKSDYFQNVEMYLDAKKMVSDRLFTHFTSRPALKTKYRGESELETFMQLFV